MYIQFEIETIFELKAHNNIYVLSRLITKNINGQLTDNSKLGGVAIEKWFDIPRAHDKEGNLRLDLYAFALKNSIDKDKLKVGQIVDLIL